MSKPRIVGESRYEVIEAAPPSLDSLYPHEWLSEESREEYDEIIESRGFFETYLSESANAKMISQAMDATPKRLEVMGFMLGEVSSWDGRLYSIIWGVGTTALKNTTAKVRFDHEALPRLFNELDRVDFDYIIVGWYHSHPGHTCFLSKTDLNTQKTMFDMPFHTALVVDPINSEIKMFKLSDGGYREVPFAITRADKCVNRANTRRRTRRLRS